jgi:ATP-dependent helicase HrpB
MRFDTPLPIDDVLPEMVAALSARTTAVLVAPPGAGKTTRLPLALLDAPWRAGRKILVLEPRRIAARGAAERMAHTLGERVGDTVGLRARLGTKVGPKTVIEVVTEGVFTRMILDDPALENIGAVLFDEFHERSLDADLGLALVRDCQKGLREDLRVLVMSATLDGARVAALLDNCPVIQSEGRAYPVATHYLGRGVGARIEDQMTDAVLRALRSETGSVLAFLPGQGEIRRTEQRLADKLALNRLANGVEVVGLHGGLEPRLQDKAIAPAPQGVRKVVLATSVAETSLTIEGVRIVIDCGFARVPRFEPDVGVTRLETVRVSRAAADQRRGRAGRTEPGVCYRLWDEPETQALRAFATPEILAADLTGLMLDCASWGVTDPATLDFLDPPPQAALAAARDDLTLLGALDADGRLTQRGQAIQKLPLPARLAAMVLEAGRFGEAEAAAEIAAVIVERGLGGPSADLDTRLDGFRRDRGRRADDMRRLASGWAKAGGGRDTPAAGLSTAALLALAFPDRIGKARGAAGAFVLVNGRGANLEAADGLARAPFLVVAEMSGKAQATRILLAARLEPEQLELIADGRITQGDEVQFDPATAALRARRTRRLGAIVLDSSPQPVPASDAAAAALADGLAKLGIERLPWSKAQSQLRDRIGFLRQAATDTWPDLGDMALAATALDWLAPFLAGKTKRSDIGAEDLQAALDALLPWDLRRRLDTEAPTHFEAPTGNRHAIVYEGPSAPILSIRVQELFGLTQHPSIAQGRLPLTLELLSPAHRPIQITRDLPGFWRGSWALVKSDMRGRYPRHPWPDDPANAAPTARAKPRGT